MIGGQAEAVQRLDPIFKTIAPGAGGAEPPPSRTRTDGTLRMDTCTAARTAPGIS